MRLKSLQLRGVTRFANTVSVDFAALPAGLIALVGANGEGKTTIMEAIPGALFRQLPSRDGALPKHCQGRDAFIELDFDLAGNHYRSLVKVDAQAGTQEAHLFNGTGNTPLVSGKVKEFDDAIKTRVTSPEIFLASVFASQTRKGNFLDLSKSDRKDLFIRMLGLEQLQRISDAAGTRAKALETDVAAAQARVGQLEAQLAGLEDLRGQLAEDADRLADADKGLATVREQHRAAVEREAKLRAEHGRTADLQQTLDALRKEIATLEAHRQDQETRRQNNQSLIDQASVIRGAVRIIQTSTEAIAEKRQALQEMETALQTMRDRQEQAQAKLTEAAQAEREYAQMMETAREERRRELAVHDTAIAGIRDQLAKAKQEIAVLGTQLDAQRREAERLDGQTLILTEIPCGDQFPKCPLISQAVAAKHALPSAAAEAKRLESEVLTVGSRITVLEGDLLKETEVREAFAAAPVDEPLDAAFVRETAEALRKQAEREGVEPETIAAARAAVSEMQGQLKTLETQVEQARPAAERLPQLEAAEERIAELTGELARIDEDLTVKGGRLRDINAQMSAVPTNADVEMAQAATVALTSQVAEYERVIPNLQARVGGTRARIADLEALEPTVAQECEALSAKLQDLAGWKHLARAFGKDGIQALEIDAAGPEVSALINELLASCFGPRFTLSFETTRPKADGKGDREVFDIRIIDNERGREGRIETLSGGEKVILNEAISLALAIYNTRKSGRHFETLFRDETAGALDPQNADRYLSMLRRALELGGFHQLIFIAHAQELWEAADARVFVRGGNVEVA